jgi:hypothetical protein
VKKPLALGALTVTSLAMALVLAPAMAAQSREQAHKARPRPSLFLNSGWMTSFTPAVADPRLAAELSRRGIQAGGFRFTPSTASTERSRAIRVAVRARASTPAEALRSGTAAQAAPLTAIAPTAYNLGVAVGWRRFALTGDVAKVSGGPIPGGREAAEVGVSYSATRFTGRVDAGVGRSEGVEARIMGEDSSYSVGVGGSYRLTRNLDVGGGVRYKIQHDRIDPSSDQRRDSQAVYIGTVFRF